MSKWKKRLAALLAVLLLVALVPTALAKEPGIMPMSMQPLKEKSITISLKDDILLPSELAAVPVSKILGLAKDKLTNGTDSTIISAIDATKKVAWVKSSSGSSSGWGFSDENDCYTVSEVTDKIDLTPNGGDKVYLEMIVGEHATDQLASDSIRLLLTVQVNNAWNDIIKFKVKNSKAEDVLFSQSYYPYSDPGEFYLTLDAEKVSWKDQVKLSMGFADSFTSSGIDVKVYEGYYKTAEEITADTEAKEITSPIWGSSATGYEAAIDYGYSYFTIQFERSGVVSVLPLSVYMNTSTLHVSAYSSLYTSEGSPVSVSDSDYDYNYGAQTITIYLNQQPLDAQYRYKASIYDPQTPDRYTKAIEYVECAVVGNKYYTVAEAKELAKTKDIKADLFSGDSKTAYLDDFKTTKYFTVVLKDREYQDNGYPELFAIRVETYVAPEPSEPSEPSAPRPDSEDTYFRIKGAGDAADYSGSGYNVWLMPYDADGYYYGYADSDTNFGFQNVLIIDNTSALNAAQIYPAFETGDGVKVYAGHKGASGTLQTSKKSVADFTSGDAIQYSAVAENDTHLKNYWVTFLTPQSGGAKLFVNATNENLKKNIRLYDEKAGMFIREVYLDAAHGYHHDIFIANIGDQPLENITVTLDADAQKVLELDPYWTVSGGTLAAFDKVTKAPGINFGELSNVAKIRLIQKKDDKGNIVDGEISGTVTISSSDGSQTIKLTGFAGDFMITTEELIPAVKYVPYSTLIQTNVMGASDAVTFTDINIPSWLTLKPNGELYGIPMETGSSTVELTATYSRNGIVMTDTRSFELIVEDNTDVNVWNYDSNVADWENRSEDRDYAKITVAIPNQDGSRTNVPANAGPDTIIGDNSWNDTWQLLWTEGLYDDFLVHVYIDGNELTEGTDYTHESGSTKITIRTQTLRNAGTGTHTIAAEFRSGKNPNATPLHRAAQNYTVTSASSGSNGGNNGGNNGGTTTPSYQVIVSATTNGTVTATPTSAKSGATITITATPNDGYKPGRVTVTDSSGNSISVINNGDGTYTFTMPASQVTVSVSFAYVVMSWANPFTDVYENDWFHDSVRFVFENDIMTGTSATTFEPFAASLRNMIVTVLWRIEGSPNTTYPNNFTDVPENSWYTDAVHWAAKNGIVQGYGNGVLGATNALTREQMVCMLYRYAVYKGLDVADSSDNLNTFTDSDKISDYAVEAMNWAIGTGVIKGKGQGLLDARGGATRAELAAILERFCKLSDELANKQ